MELLGELLFGALARVRARARGAPAITCIHLLTLPSPLLTLPRHFSAHYSTVLRAPLSPTADLAELPPSWISTLDVPRLLTSDTYDPSVNRYGVKAGQGLREWESQGWVREQDPRGWFQVCGVGWDGSFPFIVVFGVHSLSEHD